MTRHVLCNICGQSTWPRACGNTGTHDTVHLLLCGGSYFKREFSTNSLYRYHYFWDDSCHLNFPGTFIEHLLLTVYVQCGGQCGLSCFAVPSSFGGNANGWGALEGHGHSLLLGRGMGMDQVNNPSALLGEGLSILWGRTQMGWGENSIVEESHGTDL